VIVDDVDVGRTGIEHRPTGGRAPGNQPEGWPDHAGPIVAQWIGGVQQDPVRRPEH
jgi:hypothetical protein